ncbi:MAG: hypothetical protein Q8Q09_07180 [Deltaproteobacteria bacterium]|nr:hypothetical protein [Deltaproteobacteria bacterium]
MTSPLSTLLERLIRCRDQGDDPSLILHEQVLLERLDGVVLRGRNEVIEAVSSRESGARLTVLMHAEDCVHVSLSASDLPGEIRFLLRGAMRDGLLVALVMEV